MFLPKVLAVIFIAIHLSFIPLNTFAPDWNNVNRQKH